MRREARALLSAATVSATLSRMYVWHGTDDVSTHTKSGGSDRLVPPRLRRAAHLLTEYHRDSYITTIMVHTPAMRTTGCSRELCIEVDPEVRSLALLPPHRAAMVTAMAVS